MARSVVLRHSFPDGSAHLDWMIEDPALEGERTLWTWRLDLLDDPSGREPVLIGEQIGLHRTVYLDFVGKIPGDRGEVERVRSGVARWVRTDVDSVLVGVTWDGLGAMRYRGARVGGGVRWRFEVLGSLDECDQI